MNSLLRTLQTQLDEYDLKRNTQTLVRLFSFDLQTKRIHKLVENSNLVLYSGADILARLLSANNPVPVNTMYLEFKNLAHPEDPITPPSFDRSADLSYYTGLPSGSDFLRIPLYVAPTLSASAPQYKNNQITFFGISEGLSGFNGTPFNPSANSTVFGAALVAAANPTDQSQDLIFSREYAGIGQILKESGFEVGITWTIRFN